MSLVTIHGPNTMYTTQGGVVQTSTVRGVANPTNGLKWDFNLVGATTRPDQDFSWAFPTDGTPTPQTLANPTETTYATPGSKTATLTVTNVSRTVSNKALTSNVATLTTTATHGFKVGQSVVVSGVDATFNGTYTIASTPTGTTFTYAKTAADVTSVASGGTVASDPAQSPAAGSYPITINATAGVPRMAPEGLEAGEAYDPGAHTVSEVMDYVNAHPDEASAVFDAEVAGKNRSTLLTQLTPYVPFDPSDYTVGDVVAYAQANPGDLEEIIAAEEAGKNRSTLLNQLYALRG